jgi:predicted TIM-barrel fold metal-dependent hydrolase
MTIDSLVFLGTSRFGPELPVDAFAERWRTAGVTAAVASPPHPVGHDFARANQELADAVHSADGYLVGLARIDPWDGDAALALMERAVGTLGLSGLFLNPFEEHFRINDARLRPVARLAADLNVPVVIATGYPWVSEPNQVAEFASWCPDVPVVMTNGGQYNISGLAQTDAALALALDNVHIHSTGVYREDFLQRTVDRFGAHRVLFASSAPYFNAGFEKRRVELAHIGEDVRQAVLTGNAQRLFFRGQAVTA